MASPNLIFISITAFIAVFVLLTVLATLIKATTSLFPAPEKKEDSAVIAALSTTLSSIYPGSKITMIKEEK
ncbi:MAG: hypothetical protein ACLFR2_08055 [Candidatus Kapaibacterium sp.]